MSIERQRGRDSAELVAEQPKRETQEQLVLTQGHTEVAKHCTEHQRGQRS